MDAVVFFLVAGMFFQSSACYCTPFYIEALFVQLNYFQFILYDSDIHLIFGQWRLLFRNERGLALRTPATYSVKATSVKAELMAD